MKIAVYKFPDSKRSELIGNVMHEGIGRVGDEVALHHAGSFREVDADVAVFYGLMKNIMDAYRAASRPFVYIDLGYWGRHEGGRRAGFHKVSVNARHPNAYFQRTPRTPERFEHFAIPIKPWRQPVEKDVILLCGMSAKASRAEGYGSQTWETAAVNEMRLHTKRRIIYRPKPNWPDARPIAGSEFVKDYYKKELAPDLLNCHALVSHHSNANVDAILEGIPSYCVGGVALPLSHSKLSQIEQPRHDGAREQWAYDIAWTQWSVEEMRLGTVWRHLRDEGLVDKGPQQ